jgi:aryl-alcohol dehydrogenase-like predicted oxidoreductase
MDYRKLGRTGLKVSEFCLGTMTFEWTSSREDSLAVLDRFWESGGNFIDTADVYSRWAEGNDGGVAETVIGEWMQGKPRTQIILATKVRGRMWDGPTGEGLSRHHIMAAVEGSLRRLQTDYIDLYQTHAPDWDTPLDETLRVLDDLVTSGKVRYIGASNHRAWLMMKTLWTSDRLRLARYDCIQPHYHLLNRAEVEPELAAVCVDQGIAMIPYSPLAGGFLTGKYQRGSSPATGRGAKGAADHDRMKKYKTDMGWATLDALRDLGKARDKTILQMALGWQLSLPWVTSPIIGANTVTQLDESLGAVGLRLSDDEMSRLDDVTGTARDLGMNN